MFIKPQFFKRSLFVITIATLMVSLFTNVLAQRKPEIFNKNPKPRKNNEKKMCTNEVANENSFCEYYLEYISLRDTNPSEAAKYRNRMVYLVKAQIDEYYNGYKKGKVKKRRWYQLTLDFLELALDLSGTIVNGARPKTILSAIGGSFQSGRNSLNQRFKILQHQILINKMNANRTEQWAIIINKMNAKDNKENYPWEAARDDLQQYFFRGNLIDALDYLVAETGAEVDKADEQLKRVLKEVTKSHIEDKRENYIIITNIARKRYNLQKDIDELTKQISDPSIAAEKKEKLKAEKEEKEKAIKGLRDTYEKIWTSILALSNKENIDKEIAAKFKNNSRLTRYETLKTSFADTSKKATIELKEYGNALILVNSVVSDSSDTKLKKQFNDILNEYKLQQ